MEILYHVDLFGNLEVGDSMSLYWPPKVNTNEYALPPDDSMNPNHDIEILKEVFPDGLSSHGARHALSAMVGTKKPPAEGGVELPLQGEYHGLISFLYRSKSKDSGYEGTHYEPGSVLFEAGMELVRQAEYEDEQSRFQSYFGGRTFEEADRYRQQYRGGDGKIVEVECESFEVRDMDLVEATSFIDILRKGRKYWEGDAGSDDPNWEVLMEPPVKVVDIVDI
ncbi:hypothetical protein EGH22_00260 [Halomicroarcula sp. F28]|uniref:hypothetical protein n=1 Tax=Haloarcula salinisoli TaxID=2487746 RepID=UPI001C72FA41|nr:hypothetical protein [Halomicroarcula salinisoli]MBX0284749.1 hypothetical protein [Halomicroarcula salinisoli]